MNELELENSELKSLSSELITQNAGLKNLIDDLKAKLAEYERQVGSRKDNLRPSIRPSFQTLENRCRPQAR